MKKRKLPAPAAESWHEDTSTFNHGSRRSPPLYVATPPLPLTVLPASAGRPCTTCHSNSRHPVSVPVSKAALLFTILPESNGARHLHYLLPPPGLSECESHYKCEGGRRWSQFFLLHRKSTSLRKTQHMKCIMTQNNTRLSKPGSLHQSQGLLTD